MRVYAIERAPHTAKPKLIAEHIEFLAPWWGMRMVSEIKGATCRTYVESRRSVSLARRELETLRAAVNSMSAQIAHRNNWNRLKAP